MKKIHFSTDRSAFWVLGGLALLVLIGVVMYWRAPEFALLSYVGGVSTLATALLTVAYVITTSRQLSVMNAQLEQMRRSRDFQAQPLPVVQLVEVRLEKPRFFYTPPENSYCALSRVYVSFFIKNEGTHPAISIVSNGRIGMKTKTGEVLLDSRSEVVDVVPESGVFPPNGKYFELMFTGDSNFDFIESLRMRDIRAFPVFGVRTVFKNALGSSFAAVSHFNISVPDQATEDRLTAWHAALVSFSVQFKSDIERLKGIRSSDRVRWDAEFDQVQDRFQKPFVEDDDIKLQFFGIPLSFSVEPLSEDEYAKEVRDQNFGTPLPHWVTTCVHKD